MRTWVLTALATVLGACFVAIVLVLGSDSTAGLVVSNGGQLAAAALGALGCAAAAHRSRANRRTGWIWLSAGTGCWAAGQAVFSYYEVILDQAAPFPSFADLGFLLFPVACVVGLVMLLGTQSHQLLARGRDIFDGALIAGALLLLSWVTTLGSVVRASADTVFSLGLSLAYPGGDIVLTTLVLIAFARAGRGERATFGLLALGLGGLAFSDSAYVYATTTDSFDSGSLIISGWFFGFLYVAVAGFAARAEPALTGTAGTRDFEDEMATASKTSLLRLLLPYVPVVAAGVAVIWDLLRSERTPLVDVLLGTCLVLLVLIRQFLAMVDNQRLMVALGVARDQLQHQALHDDLTGLANRVLFADRLDRALMRPSAELTVMYCDLDDFKIVNDRHGHDVGDAYLVDVARSLMSCVRVTDTVARLGGDEFAILLEDAASPDAVADRVVAAVTGITQVSGRPVCASISVGLVKHRGIPTPCEDPERRDAPGANTDMSRREATAAHLLRTADSAMYAAKGSGKNRAVLASGADNGFLLPPGSRVVSHH